MRRHGGIALLIVYRLAISLFAAWVLLRAPWPEKPARLGLGRATEGAHIWWHGASVGELVSSRPLLERVIAARPDLHVLVTANTPSGCAEVAGWRLPRVSARLAPVDLGWLTRAFMRRWRVVAHVSLEAEIWPHRVFACPGPVIVIGARLTARTAKGWARMPRLAARLLRRLIFVSPQDAASAERLRDLGLPEPACGPVVALKAHVAPRKLVPDHSVDTAFKRANTWLAASTHDGEEKIVLDAHRRALQENPALRLIIAPRHPQRGDAVETAIRDSGFRCARRSRGEPPGDAAVYLADTLGEMDRWYAAAGRVFIGGTLTPRGGHTPFEPAAYGAALIHGPDVANFVAPFAALDGLAMRVTDSEDLSDALRALADPGTQARIGAETTRALMPSEGLEAVLASVLAALPRHAST
jgi:3-deoxy-D-manno-octulosonic-acid transferase